MLKVTNENYCATIIKLPPKQKVEGLDKLVKVTVFGNDVLVGTDEPENELFIFFPVECKLSSEFLHRNNLYREPQMNADINKRGFFELNGRVKAIKFKGVISTGFIIPVSSVWWAHNEAPSKLKVGDEFNEIDGKVVCEKYVRKYLSQNAANGDRQLKINNKLADLMIPSQFRFHSETKQLGKSLHMFDVDDMVVMTDKWHGSSCIISNVLIKRELTLWQKFLNFIGGEVATKKYGYIYASGKPKSNLPKGIEGEWINDNKDYYITNIWKRAFGDYKYALEPGISLYGELVGYTEGGQMIQKGYDYGCEHGKYKFLVYRITYTKPDGNMIEFTWHQIKDYCKKFNLEYVKELKVAYWSELMFYLGVDELPIEIQREKFLEALQSTLERTCPHCTTGVPSEGVVIRRDGGHFFDAFKLKSKGFLKHETEELDTETINIEEEANNA